MDLAGIEPACCLACKASDHPMQSQSPKIIFSGTISDTIAVYTGNDPVWIPACTGYVFAKRKLSSFYLADKNMAGGHSMQPHRPIILSTPCWCRTNLSWASTMRCHWFSWRGRIKWSSTLSILNRLHLFIFQGSFLHPTGACSVRWAGNAGLEPATMFCSANKTR